MLGNPWLYVAALLLWISSVIGAFSYGDHVGQQEQEVSMSKTNLAYANRAIEGEQHARAVEEQSNEDLEQQAANYDEQIRYIKQDQAHTVTALNDGSEQLRIKLATALSNPPAESSATTGGDQPDSTAALSPAVGGAVSWYAIGEYNAVRAQLAACVESYDSVAAAMNGENDGSR